MTSIPSRKLLSKHSRPRTRLSRWIAWAAFGGILGLWLAAQFRPSNVGYASNGDMAGRIIDEQGEPIHRAEVKLFINDADQPVSTDSSQPDGSYLLSVPDDEAIES